MRGKRELEPDERALWKRVAKTVKRKPGAQVAEEPEIQDVPAAAAPRVEPKSSVALPPSTGVRKKTAQSSTKAEPSDRAGEKRVRRGKLEIDGTLDLHGLRLDAARDKVMRFVARSHARGARIVIVITGKGRDGEGAIKRAFPGWLADATVRPLLSGYAQAHREHGGAGAFYVFIKRASD